MLPQSRVLNLPADKRLDAANKQVVAVSADGNERRKAETFRREMHYIERAF